jgi:hypothetical protein
MRYIRGHGSPGVLVHGAAGLITREALYIDGGYHRIEYDRAHLTI